MKKHNEDYRRELCVKVLEAFVGSSNSTSPKYMKKWVDEALSTYDFHFDEVSDLRSTETYLD